MAGCVPILGRLKTAAVFPLDDCMRPIYGVGVGYVDDCFAALDTSDNMDEGDSFTRRCADGRVLYHEDGEQSLQSVEVNLDLNAEPAEDWMIQVGLAEPIMNNGEVIGWTRCTTASANLLVLVWQEVIGSDGCEDPNAEGGWRLHAWAIRKARLTIEGGIGAEDSYIRITGTTAPEANLGAGPIPLLAGSGGAVFPIDALEVCHHTVLTHGVAAPPTTCGVLDTTTPPVTGVVPGGPGHFTPYGSQAPANLLALDALGALGQTTAWGVDQFVVLGDASEATWDGSDWVVYVAP